ncbi:hypothetical protein, partial [Salmonella enterica]|uniref:hypothetical protein n=1 Tax=Salmonella enterica TaxID=28901 RepID=UPI00234A4F58
TGQTKKKKKGQFERVGFLFYFFFAGKHCREGGKPAGSGFERCAAPARGVGGRRPAINCQTSNKAKGPIERLGLFAFIFLWKKLSDNGADAFYIWFIPFILQVAYVLATDYSAHSWALP